MARTFSELCDTFRFSSAKHVWPLNCLNKARTWYAHTHTIHSIHNSIFVTFSLVLVLILTCISVLFPIFKVLVILVNINPKWTESHQTKPNQTEMECSYEFGMILLCDSFYWLKCWMSDSIAVSDSYPNECAEMKRNSGFEGK